MICKYVLPFARLPLQLLMVSFAERAHFGLILTVSFAERVLFGLILMVSFAERVLFGLILMVSFAERALFGLTQPRTPILGCAAGTGISEGPR